MIEAKRKSTNNKKIDHREGVRCRALALAEIQYQDGQREAGIMYNISSDGMLLLSKVIPEVNSNVDIYIAPSAVEDQPVRIPGLVVHRGKSRFGMTFRKLDNASRKLVNRLLNRCSILYTS